MNELFNITDRTGEFEEKDRQDNKTMSILAYIGPLFLVPLFAAKESKSARFNTNQGIINCIIAGVSCFVLGLLGLIPYIGFIFRILEGAVGAGCTVLAVFGIVNAARGKVVELPIIGKFKILK